MTETAGPAISAAVCIDENLLFTVYMQSIQLTSLNQHRFPLKVDSLSDISNRPYERINIYKFKIINY